MPPGNHADTRPFRPGPYIALLLSAVIGTTALFAFSVFLYTGPWKVLVLFEDTVAILAFDLGLSLIFFTQHSGMVRATFKAWFSRLAPEYYHGAIFSITAGLCLYAVIHFWQASDLSLLTANDTLRLALRAVFFAALGGIVWSYLALHAFDSLGLQAIRYHLQGKPPPVATFTVRGPYRWVRHPQYFCVLLMIWSYPDLTADRLLFNLLWSTWIVIGSLLEERDLTAAFGQQYREYQARVPMLIPLPGSRRQPPS